MSHSALQLHIQYTMLLAVSNRSNSMEFQPGHSVAVQKIHDFRQFLGAKICGSRPGIQPHI